MESDIKSILNGLRHISTQIDKLNSGEWQSQSKDIAQLHASLCVAQRDMEPLVVDSSGYTNKYVSLPGLIEHIKKPLGDNGLAVTQEITELNGRPYIITTLRHESGEWLRSKAPIFFPQRDAIPTNKDYNQECGKAISYMRRYALESILLLKGDSLDYDGK